MARDWLARSFSSARGWLWGAVAVLLLAVLAGTVLAAVPLTGLPGDIDIGFGSSGLVSTDFGGAAGDKAFAIAVQTDTMILVAGSSDSGAGDDIAVARYDSDGLADSSFGASGILTTAIGPGDDVAHAVGVQGDGKIVVAGSTFDGVDWNFALVRYTDAGVPDTTFNSTGIVTLAITAADDIARAIAIQPDGKIVVAGYANNDFALVRYKTDGSLDTTGFGGGDGIVTTDLYGSTDRAYAIAIQPDDGKLLVAGFSDLGSSEDFAVARYNTDGTLDNANFGFPDGWVTTNFGFKSTDQAYSVAVQPDGKIVLAGFVKGNGAGASDDFASARYLSNGTPDAVFGASGWLTTSLSTGDDQAYSVAIQPTGKIVLAGFTNSVVPTKQDYALVRYTVTGTLDITFGATGIVTTDLGAIKTSPNSADEAYAMALQADSKILVAGFTDYPAGNDNFGVVRYLSPNSAPVITDVAKAGVEDAPVAFTSDDFASQFSDSDHDVLVKIQIMSLPLAAHGQLELTATPVTITQEIPAADLGNLVFVPTADWSGLSSFDWNGSDGIEYATTGASVTLSISPVNDMPSFTAGVDQSVNEDAGPQVVSAWATGISAGPADEAGQVVTFTLETGNDILFADLPDIDALTGDLTYTPADDLYGSSTVTVTLVDNGGTTDGGVDTSLPKTFTITVHPVNDAPSFTSGVDQVVDEDAGPQTVSAWATNISAGAANETGQVLTFTLTTGNDALFASLPAIDAVAGDLTYTPADNLYGGATVTATLQDDGGTANGGVNASLPQTFTITVLPVNDAPVVSDVVKVGPQDMDIHFATADFSLQFSDVDGDSLVQIQVLSLPAFGSLELSSVPVTVNQEIPISDTNALIFVPDAGWHGDNGFGWNGYDGMAYSPVAALVNIAISQNIHRVYLPLVLNNH